MARRCPVERFKEKVLFRDEKQCWEWTANKNNKGYGMFRPGGTANKILAHRFSYEINVGPVPKGKVVCHKCDNPSCVNPNHLFVGTMKENLHDMIRKGRSYHPPMSGTKNGNAILKEKDISEIRALHKNSVPIRIIAAEFKVKPCTIYDVLRGRSWNHI